MKFPLKQSRELRFTNTLNREHREFASTSGPVALTAPTLASTDTSNNFNFFLFIVYITILEKLKKTASC